MILFFFVDRANVAFVSRSSAVVVYWRYLLIIWRWRSNYIARINITKRLTEYWYQKSFLEIFEMQNIENLFFKKIKMKILARKARVTERNFPKPITNMKLKFSCILFTKNSKCICSMKFFSTYLSSNELGNAYLQYEILYY